MKYLKNQPCKVKTINRLADLPIKTPEEAKKLIREKFCAKDCKEVKIEDFMKAVKNYNLRVEITQYGENWTYDFAIMKLENFSWITSAQMFYCISRGAGNWELMNGSNLVKTSKGLKSCVKSCLDKVKRGNEMLTLKKASKRRVGYSTTVEAQ